MEQTTINQRLKFLIKALEMSSRAFSAALDVSDANTTNYLSRGSKPNSDYLEKILRKFESVNPTWLLTGEGTMFRINATDSGSIHNVSGGNVVGQNNGSGSVSQTHNTGTLNQAQAGDCEQKLAAAEREITFLRTQVQDKELIIQLLQRTNTPPTSNS